MSETLTFPPDYWENWCPTWLTPELTLEDWQDRINRVAAQECEYFGSLPYVRGVAVVGSVGRGGPWPWSDIDMLVAADRWQGQDPEPLIKGEEKARNDLLAAAHIPNSVEPGHWVVLADDVGAAATEEEDAFFERLEHPHWRGIVIKAEGATAARDFDGKLAAFLERCNTALFGDRFVEIWVRSIIDECSDKLESAGRMLEEGDCVNASLEILRCTFQPLPGAYYALWRILPQSTGRSASRFLAAAERVGNSEIQRLYLRAAGLEDNEVPQHLGALPAEGKRFCDVQLAVRRGSGEDVSELANARDFLNLLLVDAVWFNQSPGPRPAWTGCTDDEGVVRRRLEAAEEMLLGLREAHRELKGEMAP